MNSKNPNKNERLNKLNTFRMDSRKVKGFKEFKNFKKFKEFKVFKKFKTLKFFEM